MDKMTTPNQLKAFEEFKENSKETYKELSPLNVTFQNYNRNKYKGVKNTPYFSIGRRYIAKKMTSKKKEEWYVTLFYERRNKKWREKDKS